MKNSTKTILFLIIIMTQLWSCKYDKTNTFILVNNSEVVIDSAKISCSSTDYKEKTKPIKLLPNDSITTTLEMNNIKNVDGNYFIELFFKDKTISKPFGYYSNGNPSNSIYKLSIKKDTIMISEIMKR